MANDYSKLSKEELLEVIKKLESRKKYGLVWDEEKTKEQFEKESENALPVLKEVKSKEIITDPEKPINILIEGDNYHALSVLNYTHQGKIDVIYIDPPYNTGNRDFVYNDDYIDEEDTYRHSKWLSFMNKRLRLAKNLLSPSGIILISIDTIELAQLKILMDEIFGENNFVNNIVWKKTNSPKAQANTLGNQHEYILFYAKDFNQLKIQPVYRSFDEKSLKPYSYEDKKGRFRLIELEAQGSQRTADRKKFKFKGRIAPWLYSLNQLKQWDKEGLLYITKHGRIAKKQYLASREGILVSDIWIDDEIRPLQGSSKEYTGFLSQKPLSLLKRIIKLHPSRQATVLDFFAGSGTTGIATELVNKDDGGARRFILCTYNRENGNGKIIDDYLYPRIKKAKIRIKYFVTTFIKRSINKDNLKIRITQQCTEMLCLREGIYNEKKKTSDYRIFEQNSRIMAVYYSLERKELKSLKKDLDKMKGEKILYCFTLDPLGLDKNDFEGWQGVSLEPIPQKILDVYEDIYEY